jgi:predicted NAD/FAD-dependent oxidoreductase
MPTTVTFASLLDPAGVVIAAGIITALVELLKRTFPCLDAWISGAFLAWLACATSSVGIHSTVANVTR